MRVTLPVRSGLRPAAAGPGCGARHSGRASALPTDRRGSVRGRQPHGAHAAEGTQERRGPTRPCRAASGPTPASDGRRRRRRGARRPPAARVRGRDRRRRRVPVRAHERRATARCSTSTPTSDLGGDLRARAARPTCSSPHITAFARASRGGRVGLVRRRRSRTGRRLADASRSCRCPRTGGDERCLLGVVHDVTEHKRIEALLAHRARHDPLTELPNRVMLLEELADALARARRATPRRVGLVLLDIDHFKIVNDSLGLAAGDELFAVVAQRVERVLRAGDTVARLGGDELAVVCNDAQDERDAIAVAERVRSVLAEPFMLDDRRGVPHREHRRRALDRRRRHARAAAARRERRDVRGEEARARPHRGVRRADARARGRAARDRESALRRALVHDEFRVHYQPLVALRVVRGDRLRGAAALGAPRARACSRPTSSSTVAEETGLIVPIGAWVLHEACAQAATLGRGVADEHAPLTVSVNLSARQLADPELVLDRRGARSRAPASTRRCWCSRSPRRRSWPTATTPIDVLQQLARRRRAHRHRRLRHRPVVARLPPRRCRCTR